MSVRLVASGQRLGEASLPLSNPVDRGSRTATSESVISFDYVLHSSTKRESEHD